LRETDTGDEQMIQTDGKTYAIKTTSDLDRIMDSLPPLTLAKLAVSIQSALEPGTEAEETRAISELSNAAFDAGIRNCGDDFAEMYFDAVIAQA
jgi:hypothetical protein